MIGFRFRLAEQSYMVMDALLVHANTGRPQGLGFRLAEQGQQIMDALLVRARLSNDCQYTRG